MKIGPALDELVERLRAAGFSADLDPEALNVSPAAVWVQPREVRDYRLDGSATLVAWVYLIVQAQDTPQALELLDDNLEGLLELVDLAESDPVLDLHAALVLPSNPATPLPAYRAAVDLDV